MLHGVEFLCSVVAAFAHVLITRALMSLCCSSSPTPARGSTKKVHPIVAVDGDNNNKLQLLLAAAAPAPPVLVLPVERMKAARGRPPRLVIPPPVAVAAARAGEGDPFAVAGGCEAEVATEVEAKGEGFSVASRRGVRHAMEDGFGVVTRHTIGGGSQLAFYGVYDGHGGRAAVDFVADKLGKNVVASVVAASTTTSRHRRQVSPPWTQQQLQEEEDDVTAAIRAAYLTTDNEFLSKGVRGGACAATALVKDGDLYVSNVGDCRAVLCGRGGAATALTADQTPGRDDERHRIESSGGYVSRGCSGVWRVQDSLAVSRAFGDAAVKAWVTCEPETTRVRLTADDCRFLVLASDGLWGKVSNQEAVDVVAAAAAAVDGVDDSCKELVAMARSRGSRDDITVMVVDLQRFVR